MWIEDVIVERHAGKSCPAVVEQHAVAVSLDTTAAKTVDFVVAVDDSQVVRHTADLIDLKTNIATWSILRHYFFTSCVVETVAKEVERVDALPNLPNYLDISPVRVDIVDLHLNAGGRGYFRPGDRCQ